MRFQEIKRQATALRLHYQSMPELEDWHENALKMYAIKTLTELEATPPEGLLDFLSRNWALVNGSGLNPTAIPDADITHLLCHVALFVAEEQNKAAAENPVAAIQLLMPTIASSIKPCHKDKPYPNLSDLPLIDVIKTHILGRQGQFLLPVQLLISPEISTLENPYVPDPSEDEDITAVFDSTLYYVNEEEKARLIHHSSLTEAISDAHQQYNLLLNDKSTLLGQLMELCKKLGINDAHGGIGTQANAGAGAYAPILTFMQYYNEGLDDAARAKIPEALHAEIKRFLVLASDPKVNVNATQNLQTCIGTIGEHLKTLVRGQESLLDQIAIGDTRKESLMREAIIRLKIAEEQLTQTLQTKTYQRGHDQLGLNRRLLSALNLVFNISSLRDVAIFTALSPEEMTELLEEPALNLQLIHAISNLENLVILISQLSLEKITALLTSTQHNVSINLIKTYQGLSALLISLSVEKCAAVCHAMQGEVLKIITNIEQFGFILQHLTPEQQTAVLNVLTPKIIKTSRDFIRLIALLKTQEQKIVVIDIIKDKLPKIIKTSQDFNDVLTYLSPEDRTVIFDLMKNNLKELIKTKTDFWSVLRCLTPSQCSAVIERVKIELPRFISNPDYWGGLNGLTSLESYDQRIAVVESMKTEWPRIIKTSVDFMNIVRQLSEDLCTTVYQAMSADWLKIIKTADEFMTVRNFLNPQMKNDFYQVTKQYWSKNITNAKNLGELLLVLSPDECVDFLDVIKNKLPKIIQSSPDLGELLSYLRTEQKLEILVDALGSRALNLKDCRNNFIREKLLHQLIIFTKQTTPQSAAKLFASALLDNELETIKTSLVNLAQNTMGWKAWSVSIWSKQDPMEGLVKSLSQLDPKWKNRIKSALGLYEELSKETLLNLMKAHAAGPSIQIEIDPEAIEKGLMKALAKHIDAHSQKDLAHDDTIEIKAVEKLIKHIKGEEQTFDASEIQALTQGHLGQLIKQHPRLMEIIINPSAAQGASNT